MTIREELRKLAEKSYQDCCDFERSSIEIIESAILAGIRLVLERDDMVVGPRTHVLKQMARLRGLAGWLEERGATSNAKMAREILEYFEGIFHDRAMTAQLLKELE